MATRILANECLEPRSDVSTGGPWVNRITLVVVALSHRSNQSLLRAMLLIHSPVLSKHIPEHDA